MERGVFLGGMKGAGGDGDRVWGRQGRSGPRHDRREKDGETATALEWCDECCLKALGWAGWLMTISDRSKY